MTVIISTAEKQAHAGHFVILVTNPAEATGPLHLWPGQGEKVEAAITAWFDEIRADLAAGKLFYHAVKVVRGNPPQATAQRHWSIRDALDREVATESIDAAPIPWMDANEWLWPAKPKPFIPTTQAA